MKRLLLIFAFAWSSFAGESNDQADPEARLAAIRRVYVDQLGGGQTSDQMRDMIITALQNSGLFAVTENKERADAILRGSSDDRIFTEDHSTSDSVGIHANAGSSGASRSAIGSGVSESQNVGAGISQTESSRIQERKHEAAASIRLVDTEGDVIWSTTQESNGAKFRGAMADVADRIARQLIADTRRARARPVSAHSSSAPPSIR
jgi:curli biogenesis system outer membrane secretion channel CsgG